MGFFSSVFVGVMWETFIILLGIMITFYGFYKKLGIPKKYIPTSLKIWKWYNIIGIIVITYGLLLLVSFPFYLFDDLDYSLRRPVVLIYYLTIYLYSFAIIYGIQVKKPIALYFSYVYIIQSIVYTFYQDMKFDNILEIFFILVMGYFVYRNRDYFGKIKKKQKD